MLIVATSIVVVMTTGMHFTTSKYKKKSFPPEQLCGLGSCTLTSYRCHCQSVMTMCKHNKKSAHLNTFVAFILAHPVILALMLFRKPAHAMCVSAHCHINCTLSSAGHLLFLPRCPEQASPSSRSWCFAHCEANAANCCLAH